jgi:hypothetical protein
MMPEEQDRLETSLRQIRPAAPPAELLARLRSAKPSTPAAPVARSARAFQWTQWATCWRGLIYGAPAAALLLLIGLAWYPASRTAGLLPAASTRGNSNDVQVGHSLLASFDTIAQMPGGAPVRFRCREWQDHVTIQDPARGMEVTETTPRVEIIPLRFETY